MTPDDARTLELGEPVRFARQLVRRLDGPRDKRRKVWKSERWPGDPGEPRSGVVVGLRTLADGEVEWGDYETPTTFHPDRHFLAILVAFDRRRSPVNVLPEHLERVKAAPHVDTVTVPRPTVPHGPTHLTVDESDVIYLREASRTLEARRAFGSNLTRTIAALLDDVAGEIEKRLPAPVEGPRLDIPTDRH